MRFLAPSPVPSHINNIGINAGAGKYRQAETNELTKASVLAYVPINIPSGIATIQARIKLVTIRKYTDADITKKIAFKNQSTDRNKTFEGAGTSKVFTEPVTTARCQARKNRTQTAMPRIIAVSRLIGFRIVILFAGVSTIKFSAS